MLKIGDRVYINGTDDEGVVKEVHPHEVVVTVNGAGGREERKYSYESLRLDPTMNEASEFRDR